jgi:hypothetical protein
VGKLAFLTLKVSARTQDAEVASVLLSLGSGRLHSGIASLTKERRHLEGELRSVRSEEAARHTAPGLEMKLQRDASELKRIQGVGTRTDEAIVSAIVRQSGAARRGRREEALALAERARRRKIRAALEKDAAIKLRREGVPLGDGAQAREVARENAVLAREVAEMRAALTRDKAARKKRHQEEALEEWREKHESKLAKAEQMAGRMGGGTGVGDKLGKAGVVVSSWGPITSDMATRADPRDNFAVGSQRAAKVRRLPHHEVAPRASLEPPPTEQGLDAALGFKASIMYSHAFSNEIAAARRDAHKAAQKRVPANRKLDALG